MCTGAAMISCPAAATSNLHSALHMVPTMQLIVYLTHSGPGVMQIEDAF